MKMKNMFFVIVLTSLINANGQELTAFEILQKSDAVVNAPKDQDFKMKLVLEDRDGIHKERVAIMLQKGSTKRIIKFLSPADQKGIAFLDLSDDMMYLYLPAFKKVRRIAGHFKNQKFAGTDFTYDDIATINYADEYQPQLINKEGDHFVLLLKPKKGFSKDYSMLKMWVRKDNFYPEKIEYYDKNNNLWKTSQRHKIVMSGKYWVAKELEIVDHKEQHSTKSILEEIKFDTDLEDKFFSKRYLKR